MSRTFAQVNVHGCTCTVEPSYFGYHWDLHVCKCPDCRDVLNSGVVLYRINLNWDKSKCPY